MTLVLRVAIAAIVAAAVIWFIDAVEWVEVDRQDPPKGEAARDRLYAARKLLANFGMHVESRTGLEVMPPAGTRMLLTSNDWSLLPGRAQQLQEWVRRGGHVVAPANVLVREEIDWMPVTLHEKEEAPPRTRTALDDKGCFDATDVIGGARKLHVCGWPHWLDISERNGVRADWRLQGPQGVEAMRVPFGAGSITLIGVHGAFDNDKILRADNPLLFATAMQAERGAPAWVVSEESRERLLPWVWHEGWAAVLLAAAAIAAGLWRSAVRFGAVAWPKHGERRSIAEQVAGTARFLRRHGAPALHEAQLRALHETAARRIPGYGPADANARIAKLAARTGLSDAQLAEAMRPTRDGRKVASQLNMMETARRRLDPAPIPPSEDRPHANQD